MKIFFRNLSKLVNEKLEFIRCFKRIQKICISNFFFCLKVLTIISLYFPNKPVLGVGFLSNSIDGYSVVVTGYGNNALADYSSAMGNGNTARGKLSVAVGTDNISGWGISTNLPNLDPYLNSNDPNDIFQIPNKLDPKYIVGERQNSMISFGISNVSVGEKSISIGIGNFSSSPYSIAIGKSNFVSASTSQAIGQWNTVKGVKSNAIGYGNVIDDNASLSSAVGVFNYINTDQSYAFGGRNTIKSNFSNSVGFKNEISRDASYSNIFGSKNTISAKSSLALGTGNIVLGHHSISIGNGDMEAGDSSVLNGSSVSGHYAVSVGHQNTVNSNNTIAIGNFINSNLVSNSVILGTNSLGESVTPMPSNVKIPFPGVLGGLEISNGWSGISNLGNGSVSVGKRGYERQIKNVATGEISQNSTDAINGSQLFSAIEAIGNVALKIGGDSSRNFISKRLGDTLWLKGGAIGDLSENNLGVLVEDEQISIKLAKNLSNIRNIFLEGGTTLNNTGLYLNNGPIISTEEIDANNKPIKNVFVTENSNAGDAVNKGYVDNLIRTQSNSKLTFESNIGRFSKKFTDPIFILGTTEEIRQQEYDSSNVVTWIEDEKLRIGTKKNFVIKTITTTVYLSKSIEISSDSIIFKRLTNYNENQNYVVKILNIGSNNIKGENIARITLNDSGVAMTTDGFKLLANSGEGVPLELNKSISFIGNNSNLDKEYFDDGGNISTNIKNTEDGAKLSIAFKKSPEFESLTLKGSLQDSPQIILNDQSGSKKITLNIDNGNGEISVEGKTPKNLSRLSNDGLYLQNQSGYSKLAFKDDGMGSVDSIDSNKRRLTNTFNYKGETKTEEIATLEDGLIFNGNVRSGNGATKLNKTVNISGADSNKNWDEFDNGENVMTKVESNNGETVIRIAMRKNLKIKNGEIGGNGSNGELKLKDKDGNEGITLNPDKIIFNNISKLDKDGNLKKNGSAGITMTQNGKPNLVDEGPATRILITDDKGNAIDEVATMKDGLKFGANTGGEKSNLLNSKVVVSGNKINTDWSKFDEGSNIMTNIDQSSVGQTNITIALKRNLELDSATFGHGPNIVESINTQKSGKDGYIKVVNKEGKTAIVIDSGNTSNDVGPSITVSGTKSVGGGLLYYLMV